MPAGPDPTTELAAVLTERITRNVPVLPVPLTAAALLEGAVTEQELTVRAEALCTRLTEAGAHLNLPKGSVSEAVATGLTTMTGRGFVRHEGDNLFIEPDQVALIAFYAASVLQLLDAPAALPVEKIEG